MCGVINKSYYNSSLECLNHISWQLLRHFISKDIWSIVVLCADPYFSQAGHSWWLGHRWQRHWAECPWKVCRPFPWTPSPAYAVLERNIYSQHLKPVSLSGLMGKCIKGTTFCYVDNLCCELPDPTESSPGPWSRLSSPPCWRPSGCRCPRFFSCGTRFQNTNCWRLSCASSQCRLSGR